MEHTNNSSNYHVLLRKLDEFTRKYYLNQIIRGSLYFTGIVIGLFVLTALLENLVFNNMSPSGAVTPRKVLFFGFAAISVASLVNFLILPAVRYFKLGKIISHDQAAQIIGTHFTEVKDKLLNVLQLKRQSETNGNAALLVASIDQKIEDLKPVPFKKAIDLQKNRKYLRYALPPLLLLLFLLVASPGLITESTSRLFNNNREYEPPAPFAFVLDNPDPKVQQYSDFELLVNVEGPEIPAEAFIVVDNYSYKLNKISAKQFSYTFSKVAKDAEFRFKGGGVESKSYTLDVLEKPNIARFDIKLDYPDYTGRKDELLSNVGDLVVPIGTTMSWIFTAEHTDQLAMRFGDNKVESTERTGENRFTMRKQIKSDVLYKVFVSNKFIEKADSMVYSLTIVPDLHPSINVESFKDSLNPKMLFFAGEASDDYGIRNLAFKYRIERDGKAGEIQSNPLRILGRQTPYEYTWDLNSIELKPGDKLTYYFEVFDNDAVNGSKSSKTEVFSYELPSIEQLEKQADANDQSVKDNLADAMKDLKKMKDQAKKLQEELLQKKELGWQERKKIENLLEQQKEVEQSIEKAKEDFLENLQNQEQLQTPREEILEKQAKIEEMFNELMDPEMKELFKKMEEMLEEMDRDKIMEQLEDMNFNENELEKELDRMLEMFKQLEFEKEIKDAADKLDSLAQKQEDLAKQNEENKMSSEELKKEQDKLNEEFKKVEEQLKKAEEKNQELEKPNDMEDTKEQQEDIKEDMENSSEQLQQNKKKPSQQSQKNAAEKMKKLSDKLNSMMNANESEQNEEDMKALRQLLENLVDISFDQERLVKRVQTLDPTTPAYVQAVQQQFKLKDDFKVVEDSLQALSKRVFQLQSFITEKVSDIKKHMTKSLKDLEDRNKPGAAVNQQYTMTYVNDLALMLNEALEQMQQQQAQQMEGDQMCQNPGKGKGGKKPKKGMGELQKDLNEQMQKMKDGNMPGNQMSKEFAKMAAQQAAIRKMLQDMQKAKQEQGKGSKELQQLMEQMDKTETELVNKKLSNETLKRQQDILTRLLESEKAERERDKDEKRESKSALDQDRKMPAAMEEYLRKRQAQIDLFKTTSPNLKPYYKNLVEEYFESLK